jgi:hypothetical protein
VSGLVCLQGGAEFGRACREMDQEVVRAAPPGPLVVLAGAAAPGADHDRAVANAVRYYATWVGPDAVAAPDPRDDPDGAVEAVSRAAMIVLPGGSPARLLDVLAGPVGTALRGRWADGAVLSGASAGAMVLCERTVVPDRGEVVDGLGLVPGLALPHFRGEDRWGDRLPSALPRWGLPECGGVVIADAQVRAVGAGEPTLLCGDDRRGVPREPVALTELLPG